MRDYEDRPDDEVTIPVVTPDLQEHDFEAEDNERKEDDLFLFNIQEIFPPTD